MQTQDIIKLIAALSEVPEATAPDVGRHVIVRGDRSGVFYGRLVSEDGPEVVMSDCRHIWYWSGAANTAELALSGVSKPDECKIVGPVSNIKVKDAIEVLDCTTSAVGSLDAVPEWSQR